MPDPRSEDVKSFSEPGEEEEEEGGAHERRAARRGKEGRRNRSEEVHQGWRGNGLATSRAAHCKAMNERMISHEPVGQLKDRGVSKNIYGFK